MVMVQALYSSLHDGTNSVIGVKPADEYQFRVFTTPVGPYFKGGAKPIKIHAILIDSS